MTIKTLLIMKKCLNFNLNEDTEIYFDVELEQELISKDDTNETKSKETHQDNKSVVDFSSLLSRSQDSRYSLTNNSFKVTLTGFYKDKRELKNLRTRLLMPKQKNEMYLSHPKWRLKMKFKNTSKDDIHTRYA